MTDTGLAKKDDAAAIAEKVLIGGDLAQLLPAQRATYYMRVCESVGLNPYTKPFEYITLNGKLTLYAKRDATDQLRKLNGVSCWITGRDYVNDVYIVTAKAKDGTGREDESTGVVSVGNLKGDTLANALMKAETKAKRRVTLSICGLGWMDETEVETVPNIRHVDVDLETGEIAAPEEANPEPKKRGRPKGDTPLSQGIEQKRQEAVQETPGDGNEPGEDDWKEAPTCSCGAVLEPHGAGSKLYSVEDQVANCEKRDWPILCWTCAVERAKSEASA